MAAPMRAHSHTDAHIHTRAHSHARTLTSTRVLFSSNTRRHTSAQALAQARTQPIGCARVCVQRHAQTRSVVFILVLRVHHVTIAVRNAGFAQLARERRFPGPNCTSAWFRAVRQRVAVAALPQTMNALASVQQTVMAEAAVQHIVKKVAAVAARRASATAWSRTAARLCATS
eukprot:6198404-Pleurochrysis_carterae.AAC.2